MSTSGGAGTLLSQSTIATYSVLGPPASLIGSELPLAPRLRPFALSRPGPVPERFLCTGPQAYRYVHKKYNTPRCTTIPPAILCPLGRGYAELRVHGVLYLELARIGSLHFILVGSPND